MLFDFTLSIPSIVTLAVTVLGALGIWFGLRNTVSNHTEQIKGQSTQIAALGTSHTLAHNRIDDVRKECIQDLAAFRVQAAQTYATHETVREVKEEVNDGMRQITTRLDRIIETRGAPRPRQTKT